MDSIDPCRCCLVKILLVSQERLYRRLDNYFGKAVFINDHNTIPDRLDKLDGYLSESESRITGIREGCEKKIVWYNSQRQQTDLAIVYIHGFSASRMETWPLCDRLAEAMGANLFYTRLTGHGQDGYALGTATVEDWLTDGMEAMAIGQHLGKTFILVGTSTGGTLATWLAAQSSVAPLIHRLILLSPNFLPKNPMAAAALWPPALRLFARCDTRSRPSLP